ncbi:tyrosine recombinase XerC [Chloroflexota bacterium]
MPRGNIRKRSQDSYEISYEDGRDAGGRRMRRYETVKGTRKNAEARLNEILTTRDKGTYILPTKMTFGKLLEQWLDSYVTLNCGLSTQDSYQSQIRNRIAPILGGLPLAKLTPRHIQSFIEQVISGGRIDGKGVLTRRTPQLLLQIIHGALEHALRMDLIIKNVANAVVLPPPERGTFTIMAAENIPRFLNSAMETAYYLVYVTALLMGTRLGEILAPRWCDLQNDMTSLSIVRSLYKRSGVCRMVPPKSKLSRRSIAVPTVLTELLRRHRLQQEADRLLLGLPLKETDLIFAHPDGSPLDPSTVSHTFVKVLGKAGIPHIRFHDLRHTHATFLLEAGVHPKIVKERLGHSSIAVTIDTYSHVVPGLQEMAARRIEVAIGDEAMRILGAEVDVERMSADVGKMLANVGKTVGKEGENEPEPHRNRTCNLLIKRLFSQIVK